MALLVHMKKEGTLLVNGAVLENASGRTVSLLLRNEAIVLRGEEVLPSADAGTPATRVYHALQCAYLFPDERGRLEALATELLRSYAQAAPSARPIAEELLASLEAGRLYAALKAGKALIQHEASVFAQACGALGPAAEPEFRQRRFPVSAGSHPFGADRRVARSAGAART